MNHFIHLLKDMRNRKCFIFKEEIIINNVCVASFVLGI